MCTNFPMELILHTVIILPYQYDKILFHQSEYLTSGSALAQ